MRHGSWMGGSWAILLAGGLLLSGCVKEEEKAKDVSGFESPLQAATPEGGSDMPNTTATVEIHLVAFVGAKIEASLRNRSETDQIILESPDLQPPQLTLRGGPGPEPVPFDERTRRKVDRSVSRAMFKTLHPGDVVLLESGTFRKMPDGLFELRWGPYQFGGIASGRWTAQAVFESRIDEAEAGAGRSEPVPGVWKGRVVSQPVEVGLSDEATLPYSTPQVARPEIERHVGGVLKEMRKLLTAHRGIKANFGKDVGSWSVQTEYEHALEVIRPGEGGSTSGRIEKRISFIERTGFSLTLAAWEKDWLLDSPRESTQTDKEGAIRSRIHETVQQASDGQWLYVHLEYGSDLPPDFVAGLRRIADTPLRQRE